MVLIPILLAVLLAGSEASISGIINISGKDRETLLSAFTSGLVKLQPNDLSSVYYGAKGYEILKEPIVQVLKMDGCAHIPKYLKPDGNSEGVFHALSAWKLLGCTGKVSDEPAIIKNLKSSLEKVTSVQEARFALDALQFLGQGVPNPAKISQQVQQLLKTDDSLPTMGHALHLSKQLGPHGKFMLDRVEDIIVQADEIDEKLLQWEGGLSTTSLLLTGLFKLDGFKALNQEQVNKFAVYLLTRRSVQTSKGAMALLEAAFAISSTDLSPVAITVDKTSQVIVDKPNLTIKITDILGRPLKTTPTPVVAQSATRVNDDVVVLSKQPLSVGSAPSEFILPLQLVPGQYRIVIAAGSNSVTIMARVLGPINLQSIEIGVGDSDGSSAPKLTQLKHPQKLSEKLKMDYVQNLIIKFNLPRNVHQAFLRVYSDKKEIIFIAEKNSAQVYKINVNLVDEIVLSGVYDMELIIGDAVMSNPIRWNLGSVELTSPNKLEPKVFTRGPKPEIMHMFRVADKRPPQVVSMFFTAAVLSPLLILFILWIKIGIPLHYINFYSLPFHIGLGGIWGLYTYFWLYGNMFTTCAWLLYIGGFTFITGNRMLSSLATQKK